MAAASFLFQSIVAFRAKQNFCDDCALQYRRVLIIDNALNKVIDSKS